MYSQFSAFSYPNARASAIKIENRDAIRESHEAKRKPAERRIGCRLRLINRRLGDAITRFKKGEPFSVITSPPDKVDDFRVQFHFESHWYLHAASSAALRTFCVSKWNTFIRCPKHHALSRVPFPCNPVVFHGRGPGLISTMIFYIKFEILSTHESQNDILSQVPKARPMRRSFPADSRPI